MQSFLVVIVLLCSCWNVSSSIDYDSHDAVVESVKIIAVLEIDSETFDESHAEKVSSAVVKEVNKLTSSFAIIACVHSSQYLIYDLALQRFLYSQSTHIDHFYFSKSLFGFGCALETPLSFLDGADMLLQISVNNDLQNLASQVVRGPPYCAADMSLLIIPAVWTSRLQSYLLVVQENFSKSDKFSRLDTAKYITQYFARLNDTSAFSEEEYLRESEIVGDAYPNKSLPIPSSAAEYHTSGPCNLWWPLNHSELFVFATTNKVDIEPSFIYQVQEVLIVTCPNLKRRRGMRVNGRNEDHYIAVLEGFRTAVTAHSSSSIINHPQVVNTREAVSLEGVSLEDDAVDVMAYYSLPPPRNNNNNVSLKWVRISICSQSIRAMSECISSFMISRTVVYGNARNSEARDVVSGDVFYHPMMTQIHTRDVFGHALNMFGLSSGTFVEIGVNRGHFAKLMLDQWRGARYVMVDPWEVAPSYVYVDIANNPEQQIHDAIFSEALNNVASFGSRPAVIRNTSVGAAMKLLDASVDIVYIDALHHYHGVMADIHAWYRNKFC